MCVCDTYVRVYVCVSMFVCVCVTTYVRVCECVRMCIYVLVSIFESKRNMIEEIKIHKGERNLKNMLHKEIICLIQQSMEMDIE